MSDALSLPVAAGGCGGRCGDSGVGGGGGTGRGGLGVNPLNINLFGEQTNSTVVARRDGGSTDGSAGGVIVSCTQ